MPVATNDVPAVLIANRLYVISGENIEPAASNTTPWLRVGQIVRRKRRANRERLGRTRAQPNLRFVFRPRESGKAGTAPNDFVEREVRLASAVDTLAAGPSPSWHPTAERSKTDRLEGHSRLW